MSRGPLSLVPLIPSAPDPSSDNAKRPAPSLRRPLKQNKCQKGEKNAVKTTDERAMRYRSTSLEKKNDTRGEGKSRIGRIGSVAFDAGLTDVDLTTPFGFEDLRRGNTAGWVRI